MSGPTLVVLLAAVWLAIGFGLSLVLGRRGHDGFSWLVVGTLLGPLAILLAIDAVQNRERRETSVIDAGSGGSGNTDVLVGVDGSPEARVALDTAVAMFGESLGRLTLLRVVPFDGGLDADRTAAAEIEREALRIPDFHPRTEVTRGNPATLLREHARSGDYDLLVIGSRGAGRHLFGSAARDLASASPIPVLVVSAPHPASEPNPARSSSVIGSRDD